MDSPTSSNSAPLRQNGSARPECPESARQLHELLASLWERSRATIAERLSALSAAQQQLELDPRDVNARASGADAAHKLAGILGTFGLPLGTDLARNAERTLDCPDPLNGEHLNALRQWIQELDAMIQQKTLNVGPLK